MKKIFTLLCATLFALNLVAAPQAIIVGHANKTVNIIDLATNKTVWKYTLTDKKDFACNSVTVLKGGKHIAIATEGSAKIIALKSKKVVWEYIPTEDKKACQVHAVVPLNDGGVSVFAAKLTGVEVIEVSPKFKTVKTTVFKELENGKNVHTMFRGIVMDKAGNYLVPWWPAKSVYRMTREGKILDKYVIGASAFVAFEDNGTLVYGTGDKSTVCFYDTKTNKVVKEVSEFSKGNKKAWSQFIGHAQKVGKDKYLISNWTGHSKKHAPKQTDYLPVVFVMNGEGKIEWSYDVEQAKKEQVTTGVSGVYYSEKAIVK